MNLGQPKESIDSLSIIIKYRSHQSQFLLIKLKTDIYHISLPSCQFGSNLVTIIGSNSRLLYFFDIGLETIDLMHEIRRSHKNDPTISEISISWQRREVTKLKYQFQNYLCTYSSKNSLHLSKIRPSSLVADSVPVFSHIENLKSLSSHFKKIKKILNNDQRKPVTMALKLYVMIRSATWNLEEKTPLGIILWRYFDNCSESYRYFSGAVVVCVL